MLDFKYRRLRKSLKSYGLIPSDIINPILKSKGISQSDIAKHLGVSQGFISQVINSKKDNPSIRATIVTVLGFDPWT